MMRKLFVLLLVSLPVAAFAADPQTVVLDVQNMTCSMCSITIRKALEKVPGVVDARVDYDHKTAIVRYDPDKANPPALVKATTNAGFPSKLHSGTQINGTQINGTQIQGTQIQGTQIQGTQK